MRIHSRLILAALASLPAVTFAATPTITSVNGTVQAGQTLTVVGTNLNNEAKANWDSFFVTNPNAWSFEGASPAGDGFGAIGPKGGVYDSTASILGSKSMKFHVQGAATSLYNQLGNYNAINPSGGDSNDLWIRAYVRWNNYNSGWPSSHIKMIDSQGSSLQYYFQPSPTSGSLPLTMSYKYDGASHSVNIPSGQVQNNRWYAVEIHWKTNATPYVFDAWIDGVQVVDATPPGQGSLNYILFGIINACCTNSSLSLDHWVDGLAVAKSRIYPSALVEVGNSSNYSTATKRTQELRKISDNQVVLNLNLTNLGSGPYYLWVTNNGQVRSQAYILGGGGGTTGLAAPKGLTVQ
ncbi:MAG: hypothetical protein ACREX3_14900 [Gammaproteobacteria bacterium]